jgi:hypothetical protein
MQIGKWRRQVKLPTVTACTTNRVSATLTRLPRNQADSDPPAAASLPRMAVAAGAAHGQNYDFTVTERLQCLLRRMGVDDSEFSLPSGGGSVHLYNQFASSYDLLTGDTRTSVTNTGDSCIQITGSTSVFPDAKTSLWDTQAHLNQYDMVFLNCQGDLAADEHGYPAHPAATNTMKSYVDAGGRMFAEHYNWGWMRTRTGTVNYTSAFGDVATWYADSNGIPTSPTISTTSRVASIDTSFPRGQAFAA